ncbi:MAG: deoxyguanosinetriphosphate triphosphohydrolase [Deinococcales bacterium]
MLVDRERLEHQEHLHLAPYAAFANKSKGRNHPEQESTYRTAFQRDRDRVIHTSAFRRLEYKTQVFVNAQGDYYRTRLTHTLEVAQVAKSIARTLGLNEDLTETIALAHDLGHPPFGHAGEKVLNQLAKEVGGFDHNKQALRVVTKLEQRYASFSGLNLTWETLEGIMKHELDKQLSESITGSTQELRPSLEAQIVDLSDAIAYNAHDLDDGLRSRHLEPEQLEEVSLLKELLERLNLKSQEVKQSAKRALFIRELLGEMIASATNHSHLRLESYKVKSIEDVRQAPQKLATLGESMKQKTKELKSFLYQNLYFHFRQIRMAKKAEYMLERLFEAYQKDPRMLPFDVQATIKDIGLIRAVTDYLAGMTDRFASEEYKRLFDPDVLT